MQKQFNINKIVEKINKLNEEEEDEEDEEMDCSPVVETNKQADQKKADDAETKVIENSSPEK